MNPTLREKLIKYLSLPLPPYYSGRSFEVGRKYIKMFNILTNGQHSAINFLNPITGEFYRADSWKQKGRYLGNLCDLV